MRFLVAALLLSAYCQGQRVDFFGSVKDQKTKQPIPYVNLSFLNTLVGTSSDENGKFLLEIEKGMLQKQVHISSLGYKDTIVPAGAILQNRGIFLKEETFELDEVVVNKNLGNVQVWNPISSYSITSGFDSSSTPWVLALYFPNIGASKKYVEKVSVFFRDNPAYTREAAKFRLRFYAVDPTTKQPGKDLVQESIVLEAHKGTDYTSLELSEKRVKIPREGIYIGLEWLFIPYNWYKKDEKDAITNSPRLEDRFAPTFGGIYSKNQNHRVMVYGMGEWREFKVRSQDNKDNFIPAISVKVTQKLK